MVSRSQMRRMAVQRPDALIKEIERLKREIDAGESYCRGVSESAAKEIARLREALKDIVEISMRGGGDYERIARAALDRIAGGGE